MLEQRVDVPQLCRKCFGFICTSARTQTNSLPDRKQEQVLEVFHAYPRDESIAEQGGGRGAGRYPASFLARMPVPVPIHDLVPRDRAVLAKA